MHDFGVCGGGKGPHNNRLVQGQGDGGGEGSPADTNSRSGWNPFRDDHDEDMLASTRGDTTTTTVYDRSSGASASSVERLHSVETEMSNISSQKERTSTTTIYDSGMSAHSVELLSDIRTSENTGVMAAVDLNTNPLTPV